MNIGIDISSVIYGTGVSVYTRELVRELVKLDKKNSYTLYGGSVRRKDELTKFTDGLIAKNVTSKINRLSPTLADIVFNKLRFFSVEKFIGSIDVFHSSDWTQPKTKAFKVTTVHDLVPLLFPDLSDPKIVSTHKRRLELVKEEADRIIVPSQTTLEDLVRLGFDESKIRVIAEAATPGITPSDEIDVKVVKKKYNISGDYLISVGVNPRKNTENIIKAFELSKAGKDLKLVLVGNPFGLDVKLSRNIRMTGYVNDRELRALYTGARALVYPSIYEGFGIPILDAFTVGTPVVTSDSGSMKEVAGNAAVLVDPASIDSMVDGIQSAIRREKSLVKKGKERVKKFSWEKMAKETLEVYSEFEK